MECDDIMMLFVLQPLYTTPLTLLSPAVNYCHANNNGVCALQTTPRNLAELFF
jgi:hypothetical protein